MLVCTTSAICQAKCSNTALLCQGACGLSVQAQLNAELTAVAQACRFKEHRRVLSAASMQAVDITCTGHICCMYAVLQQHLGLPL